MVKARKFLALRSSEQALLVLSAILFVLFSVTLRLGSLRTNETFARRLAEFGLSRWSLESADRALSVIESVYPDPGGCLPAALVGLVITDETLELQLGVRDTGVSMEAHAWLTGADGQVLYAGEDPKEFQRLRRR